MPKVNAIGHPPVIGMNWFEPFTVDQRAGNNELPEILWVECHIGCSLPKFFGKSSLATLTHPKPTAYTW